MVARLIPAVAAALLIVGCQSPAPTAPPEAAVATATTPAVQAAAFGTTLTVDSGAYTVANLRPVPVEAQIIPAKGTMFAVDVTIAAQTGTVVYNGFYFVARAQDGSTIAPAVGAVKPGITSGQLAQGQTIDGHIAFDVPQGLSITQVALRDPKGKTLAVWGTGLSG